MVFFYSIATRLRNTKYVFIEILDNWYICSIKNKKEKNIYEHFDSGLYHNRILYTNHKSQMTERNKYSCHTSISSLVRYLQQHIRPNVTG